eukprot:298702-Chlamydomonas_euryale.AAC.6
MGGRQMRGAPSALAVFRAALTVVPGKSTPCMLARPSVSPSAAATGTQAVAKPGKHAGASEPVYHSRVVNDILHAHELSGVRLVATCLCPLQMLNHACRCRSMHPHVRASLLQPLTLHQQSVVQIPYGAHLSAGSA